MDPFWDTTQTNCLFFTFSVLGGLRGNTVPSALKRTAMAPAHKPICSCVAFALLQLLADWLVEPCRGPGSSLVLGKQAAVCQGPLMGSEHSAGRIPVSLVPRVLGQAGERGLLHLKASQLAFLIFISDLGDHLSFFLFSLRKKPAPQLNRDCNPVAK